MRYLGHEEKEQITYQNRLTGVQMVKRRMIVVVKESATKVTVAQRNNLLLVMKMGMT
jgi:hypothetical protein